MRNAVPLTNARQLRTPVVLNSIGRQPLFVVRGSGLNASSVPKAPVRHVTNPLARKPN